VASTGSMMPHEHIDALLHVSQDLAYRLADMERTTQKKLAAHGAEFENLQAKLEGTRKQISATRLDKEELISTELQHSKQISALSAEVVKVSNQLMTSRTSYTSLQRQYTDQCLNIERYRNDLQEHDNTIRCLRSTQRSIGIEVARYARGHAAQESRLIALKGKLMIARHAQKQCDKQKQENILLKETIE
ncbi:hypothetical protein C8R43DRAFT_820939, partial [Mycena crocata]